MNILIHKCLFNRIFNLKMFEAKPRLLYLFIMSISDALRFKIFIDFTSFRLPDCSLQLVFNNDIYPLKTAAWQSEACESIKILKQRASEILNTKI
jgi:hypothetical protein